MTTEIIAPLDAGRWAGALTALLGRVQDPSMRYLDCGAGWYSLLARFEEEVSRQRPHTVLRYVRERDGELVIDVIDGDDLSDMIVERVVLAAATTCELTGTDGLAMVGPSGRRVLNPASAPAGWRIDLRPLPLGAEEQNVVLLRLLNDARSVIDPSSRR